MKKALYLLSLLPLLSPALPTASAVMDEAGPAVNADENEIVRVQVNADVYAHACTFAFSEPMVAPEQVGKPAANGLLTVSPERATEMTWLSASTLQVKVTDELQPLDVLRVKLNSECLRSLSGHAVAPAEAVLPEHEYSSMLNHSWNAAPGQVILFSASDFRYDALVSEAVKGAYYRVTERDEEGKAVREMRVPATVRPATVADALGNWKAYEQATNYEVSEEDRKAFETHPEDEVLPYIRCAEPYAGVPVKRSIELMLPRLGDFDEETGAYRDKVVSYVSREEFAYMLSNERTGEGEYRVKLAFTQPLSAESVPALMAELPWEFLSCRKGEEDAPLERGEDGVCRGASAFSSVELTPLIEETMAGKAAVKVSDEETAEGVSELYFRAKVAGDRVRLRMNSPLTSVFGDTLTEDDLKHYGHQDRDYTVLAPRRPRIATDLLNNTMDAAGAGVLRCRYKSLQDMHITIHRVEANSPQAAILLGKYLHHYSPATENYRFTWDGRYNTEPSALPEELWALLPHEAKTIELPEDTGETEVNLKELFGAETQGMFFIDAGGTTHPEWQKDGHVANQGLVQLTNLGLMWKLSGHSLFACAYHLSDGKPVPAAELRLLDAEGKCLTTVAVKDGLAQLPLPENVAFLQLAEGDDCYTTTAAARDCDISEEYDEGATPQERRLLDEMPHPQLFLFSDRGLYRPGETAHIKGMLRFVTGNTLSNPGLESVQLTIEQGEEEQIVTVTPADDGSFSADIPMKSAGTCEVKAVCTVKGDADKTSPDIAYLVANKVAEPTDEDDYSSLSRRLWDTVEYNRRERLFLTVSDFRRNAFEVRTGMEMLSETHAVRVTTDAVNLTGAPVAEGMVEWRLRADAQFFCPEAFPGYVFGDCRDNDTMEVYYDAYYGDADSPRSRRVQVLEAVTDEQGHAAVTFGLEADAYPAPVELDVTSSVTDGNEQTIKNSTSLVYHPCSVYAGISREESICQAGTPLRLKLVAVGKDGEAYHGAPLSATMTVTRKVAHNYRYGAQARTDVHSSTEVLPVEKRAVVLMGAVQELTVATKEAGEYTVELEGKDPEGNTFRTAVTYYVWGSDVSPWVVESGTGMRVVTSPKAYKPGDTAKVLVMTPVDGEVLLTLERGGVLRHYRRSVTVANPVVEIPVEDEDAPEVYVSAFLVQKGEKNRAANGMPLQKLGCAKLHVVPVRQTLSVELETPSETQRPGQEGTVGGIVRDADGKPVANASVTLYAEDEGVLQVKGYHLPDPMSVFMANREHGVRSYSSLNQLLGEDLAKRDFGNKGVFIGGGDDDDEGDFGETPAGRVRSDFAPCALWLADLRTDENGRFTATFRHPDTLTRYRLMAVCAAGADKFGKAQAAYKVDTPVRVEPSAPLTATVGDELELPATVSMNPAELPAEAQGQALTWNVMLSGTPNAALPQTVQTVTLNGAAPRTVMHPVTLTSAGDCKLTWRVQGTGVAAKEGDAAAFSFTVRPPMPFLREAVCSVIDPGKSAKPADWFRGAFAADTTAELTFSTSPLAGAADGVRYLITYPHGCVEQLSSAMLPWAFRKELEQAVGLRYPEGKDAGTVVQGTTKRIMARWLPSGFFAYWTGGNANRNFTPYVALVLQSCENAQTPDVCFKLRQTDKALKEELLEEADANLVGLYYLAQRGAADAAFLKAVIAKRVKPNESELWLLAATAELLKDYELSKELVAKARKAKGTGTFRYGLPSAMASESLWAVIAAPEDPATVRQLRLYVESVAQNRPTTWESGWMCLIIHEYLKNAQLADRTATLNGQELSMSKPLHLSVRAGDKTAYKAAGNPVYVSGTVEGYQAKSQPEKMVDKGFAVTRRYEKLNPDGTWTPTGTFRVGDVVRVTITAKHTDGLPAVYMALEDRLPAAFEAVNPELTSQALPEDIRTDESNWLCSGFINNREYLKDCVRFYVTRWGEGDLTARYIARVVKSGKVTALAAKAELMYRPQVYGLAIPQHFTILPR
ncbi:MAG: MG2 domain-containing protein [Akkermansia sp.]|nr:MG2 domain-containing protein [Akkermansia sp.]